MISRLIKLYEKTHLFKIFDSKDLRFNSFYLELILLDNVKVDYQNFGNKLIF